MNEIITYYDKLAKDYDQNRFENSYGKYIDTQERYILNKLLVNKSEFIVDLACGTGRFLEYAQMGIDASSEMIKVAKNKFPDKEFLHNEADDIKLDNNSVDTIICFHLFMHLNEEKTISILKECHRILKPGGRIIFDFPSQKRRKLLRYKAQNWHGAFSMQLSDLKISQINLKLNKSFGILFLPIHRFPKSMRSIFIKLDNILSNTFLKEYSSYLIVEMKK